MFIVFNYKQKLNNLAYPREDRQRMNTYNTKSIICFIPYPPKFIYKNKQIFYKMMLSWNKLLNIIGV